jgi:Stage II sporulation protein E (SpoIIE)
MRVAPSVWLKAVLAAGGLLAIALLAQTITTYRYISTNLILQEGRTAGQERVRNIERAARMDRAEDAAAYQTILDELRRDFSDQVAAVALLRSDGTIIASSGEAKPVFSLGGRERPSEGRPVPIGQTTLGGREVLTGVFTCRCNMARADAGQGEQLPRRLFVGLALYRDSLSAPFARLRRNSAISASAALALLASLLVIGLRIGPYVRGKQIESQLALARRVQRDLLPAADALPAGLDLGAECLPASQVGGDFYDVVSLPDGRTAFLLGDVSGHGISAALLMGLIHGAMSSPPWGSSPDGAPDRAAARLNQLLLAKSAGDRFASLFWCAYDPVAGELQYLNAGHLPGLRIRRAPDGTGVIERLADGGPVLGVLPGATYRAVSVDAHDGDLLVLFSDGIIEAGNARGDYFGDERLQAVLCQSTDLPARAICEAILSAVKSFAAGEDPGDDQTLLVVRLWKAGSAATVDARRIAGAARSTLSG